MTLFIFPWRTCNNVKKKPLIYRIKFVVHVSLAVGVSSQRICMVLAGGLLSFRSEKMWMDDLGATVLPIEKKAYLLRTKRELVLD